jgi:predicted nucleic acid-binding protein
MASKKTRKKATKKIQAYAFIDTNIFLDFYRNDKEASMSLLEKLETVRDRVMCTYQVEMEFLKNRQNQIRSIADQTKLSVNAKLPAVLSDTPLAEAVKKAKHDLRAKGQTLKRNLVQLLSSPNNDPVYKVLQDIFRSDSNHVLTRDMEIKNRIKRLARRRFQLGYPPRKATDTSMGDAVNWEWVIHCAKTLRGRIIIVSRDSDYGCEYDGKYFLNDQLKREFRERVGNKSIVYTHKLSDALRELNVHVTEKEEQSEDAVIQEGTVSDKLRVLQEHFAGLSRLQIPRQMQELNEKLLAAQTPFYGLRSAMEASDKQTNVLREHFRNLGLLEIPDKD